MFRIMFVLIRVFRELDRYGLARVKINYAYILRSPRKAARSLKLLGTAFERGLTRFCDSVLQQIWIQIARNQFFFRVETLYNTIVRFDAFV